MADKNFPGPKINSIPESDAQVKVVPMANPAWGGRPVSTRGPSKNGQTLKHVGKD